MRSVLFSWKGEAMPYRPKKPCRHPGCAKLTDGRYCEEHISLHPEVTRSAAKRGYDSKWRKESKVYLREHPLCEICKRNGKYVQATVVDHIKAHRGDSKLSGIRVTGGVCANLVTIKRQVKRTADQHTDTIKNILLVKGLQSRNNK